MFEVLIFFLVLLAVLATGTWIFIAVLITGLFSFLFLLDFSLFRAGVTIRPAILKSIFSPELAAIPLFIFMGEIISRTNIGARLFQGLSPWVRALPGGLLHVNVAGSVLFAALSGSSAATTATVGRVTMRELERYKYSQSLAIGSLCVAGTIGIMIPPSVTMIIYGVLAEVSVARLFAAGVVPGLLLGVLYSSLIVLRSLLNPNLDPPLEAKASFSELVKTIYQLGPIFLIIFAILGSIYGGVATPSEAAALGVVAVSIVAFFSGEMSARLFWDAAKSTVSVTAMIGTILAAAAPLASAVGYLHFAQSINSAILALDLGPITLLLVITAIYIALGMVLDGISIILITVPLVLPLMLAQGFDPIWFGVYLVLVVEMSLVTPPVGLNLFVVNAVTGVPLGRIALASLPFFLLMIVAAIVLAAFPQLALWLPGHLH